MLIHGEFTSQKGETVRVEIVTLGSRVPSLEIGDGESGVWFTADPVETTSEVNDTFDPLLRQSAVIRLLTRGFIPELYCNACTDATVTVTRSGVCVFAGFIDPQTYSQGFNEAEDELEINCIDALSAMQFFRYRDIGMKGVDYDTVKQEEGQLTFRELLDMCLGKVTAGLPVGRVWYDGSRRLPGHTGDIFSGLSISGLLFLGDTEDETWTLLEVMEEMTRYLGLHMVQEGADFRIFSRGSLKSGRPVGWLSLTDGETQTTAAAPLTISDDTVADTGTRISVGEVYNRISLTCDVKSVESVVESPLDSSATVSPFTNRQKYLTTYSSDGEGETAQKAFCDIVNGRETGYSEAVVTDWFIQVKDNPRWRFYGGGEDLVSAYCGGNSNQQRLPDYLRLHPGAALVSFGKVERKADNSDNSPVSRIDMEDCLVVSVNGNGKDTEGEAYPDADTLLRAAPVAAYTGNTSGGVWSPSDSETTNYIVISGSVILNPVMAETCLWRDRPRSYNAATSGRMVTVPSRKNDDGRFYTRQWWEASHPGAEPEEVPALDSGLVPFTDDGPREYEFRYSAIGDGADRVSKVAALACMLVIGDKCVVETGTQGSVRDFEWRVFKERGECRDDDEYYAQCFTLGFDPKIGDFLIGTDFKIQNNIDYTLGLDAEGTAIPIRRRDKVSGKVRFMILGPVATTWGEVTRRHPTWFRHTRWGQNDIPLMSHVSSIIIRDFEVKVYSDNGLVNNAGESDLVYMSDTGEGFVNVRDDITFRISSALTTEERRELGVSGSVALSTPLDTATGYGLLEITDAVRGETAKPERLYIDAYYRECHLPRVLLDQRLEDEADNVSRWRSYRHPALPGKIFHVVGISRNLMEGSAELNLKETDND